MRKKISLVLMVALLFTLTSGMSFAATPDITVTVNGTKVVFDQQPVNESGTVFVPIRGILEALGQKMEWDQKTMTATATDEITKITTVIDTASPVVTTTQNEVKRSYTMPASPMLISGRTLVPVRAISEIFAKDVKWDQKTSTVIVSDITDAKALDTATTAQLNLKDMVSVTYSTDGTATYQMAANNDFVLVTDVEQGVGAHTMYFRAETANKDAKIDIQKVVDAKVTETKTYKAVIADPMDKAVALTANATASAIVKVGDYVKATVADNAGSTGYQWFVTSLPAGLQQIEVKTSAPATPGVLGEASDTTFVFKVVAEGDMTLQLTNKRAWNDKEQTPTVAKYQITATK